MQVNSSYSHPHRYYQSSDEDSSGDDESLQGFIVPDGYVEYEAGYQPSATPGASAQASQENHPAADCEMRDERAETVLDRKRRVEDALKEIRETKFRDKRTKAAAEGSSHRTRSGLLYREDERPLPQGKRARHDETSPIADETVRAPEVTRIRFESIRKIPKKNGPHDCHVVGRDHEVIQILRMLAQPKGGSRPLLLGPAGIGKKSIVRKLADAIEKKQCPESLQGRSVYLIDCIPLLANELTATGRQELGVELRKLIEGIIRRQNNPILFFRDIDRIVELDFVTDFLQALLRTPVNVIASISDDPGSDEVSRAMKILGNYHFVPMVVGELSRHESMQIARHKLEKYPLPQNLTIRDEGIQFAVNASGEYLKKAKFPMKTLTLIREAANDVLLQRAGEAKAVSEANQEGSLELTPLRMAAVLQEYAGIAAEELVASSWENLERIHRRLSERVIGQQSAIDTVFNEVRNYKFKLSDKKKPWGVFLFVGPTGVGKTELAKCLAKELFHDDRCFIRLDMTEFSEPHSVSKLIGAPPGYVGYDEGGQLCKALKETPHCVILCDEIEKAHPEVRKIFLQIMDEGRLTDGKGNRVDCTNTLVIMTSNLGAKELLKAAEKKHIDESTVKKTLETILAEELTPEFYNRLTPVPFASLRRDQYPEVITAHLRRMAERYAAENNILLNWDESLIRHLVKKDHDPKFGMRNLCRFVELSVKSALSEETILRRRPLEGTIKLTVKNDKIAVV